MTKFALVEKKCLEIDKYHAPFETIEASSRGKAKAKYIKLYPEYEFVNILCRKSRKNVFDF